MLTQTLRDMERDGYVKRTVYADVKVEYELTELGRGQATSAWQLVSWADDHLDEITVARARYDEASQS